MKVYKFGGASVRTADGVRNLAHIVEGEQDLFIIVSAMGKTTNALERVFTHMQNGRKEEANEEIKQIQDIFRVLFQDGHTYSAACELVMAQFPESEIRNQVVEFIRNSKRGILKPYNAAAVAADE